MRRFPRGFALAAAVTLAFSAAGPVAAAGTGSIDVHVQVTGYFPGEIEPFFGRIGCLGLPQSIDFGVGISNGYGTSGPIQVPAGLNCKILELSPRYPGDLGYWGQMQTPGWVLVEENVTHNLEVTIERFYNGNEPMVDYSEWIPSELFTVDRVYLNRYGGISAEGLVRCSALAEKLGYAPLNPEDLPIANINWDATQYVGRKTAIHGSYGSDIGNPCVDPSDPSKPFRWTSRHPAGNDSVIGWLYGVDGRFASGTIVINATLDAQARLVMQWWDPLGEDYDEDCSTTPSEVGYFDGDGDGFCVYEYTAQERVTTPVRTTSYKGK